MKFFRKAQTATEYLIILAVVIVIALVVVVAMGKFPGIGSNVGTQGAQLYWTTQDVAVESFGINNAGGGNIALKNNLRGTVTINDIKVDGNSTDTDFPITLTPGARQVVQLDIPGFAGCEAGERLYNVIIIDYTDTTTGNQYRIDGKGNRYESTCLLN
jgi:hypothetical protein